MWRPLVVSHKRHSKQRHKTILSCVTPAKGHSTEAGKKRHKCIHEMLMSAGGEQSGVLHCTICRRWLFSQGGFMCHVCRPQDQTETHFWFVPDCVVAKLEATAARQLRTGEAVPVQMDVYHQIDMCLFVSGLCIPGVTSPLVGHAKVLEGNQSTHIRTYPCAHYWTLLLLRTYIRFRIAVAPSVFWLELALSWYEDNRSGQPATVPPITVCSNGTVSPICNLPCSPFWWYYPILAQFGHWNWVQGDCTYALQV